MNIFEKKSSRRSPSQISLWEAGGGGGCSKNNFWAGRVETFLGSIRKSVFLGRDAFFGEKTPWIRMKYYFFYTTFLEQTVSNRGKNTIRDLSIEHTHLPTVPLWGESEKHACKIRKARISHFSPSRGGRTKIIFGLSLHVWQMNSCLCLQLINCFQTPTI